MLHSESVIFVNCVRVHIKKCLAQMLKLRFPLFVLIKKCFFVHSKYKIMKLNRVVL